MMMIMMMMMMMISHKLINHASWISCTAHLRTVMYLFRNLKKIYSTLQLLIAGCATGYEVSSLLFVRSPKSFNRTVHIFSSSAFSFASNPCQSHHPLHHYDATVKISCTERIGWGRVLSTIFGYIWQQIACGPCGN